MKKRLTKNINLVELYKEDIGDLKFLEKQELRELLKRYKKEGDLEAYNKIVKSFLPLVIFVAKMFNLNNGVSFLDLIQVGNLSLMRAIEYWEEEKGIKIETYIIVSVYRAILWFLKKNEQINSCFHICYFIEDLSSVSDTTDLFLEKLSQIDFIQKFILELSEQERTVIIDFYGLNREPHLKFKEIGKKMNLTRQRIKQIHTQALSKLRKKMNLISLLDG